ncbi:MAG: Type II secretion system F domain protein [Methanomicrobiales archaeon 53_19]|jgi:flagellar protein FlaJ|uniref:type II secretion system F family protein n=1 Tax=Methanocalculus sp. TaxID=2004547 RepID=UPI0007479D8A|nr:type II secretion system F family protein [Methanocalculus sp.]KUK70989.1 MAG: Type II secretion system F domain protein [Methanocalculus sp. 52_23]KUL04871.1 MAG: Type II secretion system F domain protein [Methanomicrobiales archaeon 53_19]HIJ06119.1 type II secretion system F family protein [Methanocalculus sp.]
MRWRRQAQKADIDTDRIIHDQIERRSKKERGFSGFIQHPVQSLIKNPIHSLYLTIPLSLVIAFIWFFIVYQQFGLRFVLGTTIIDDILIVTTLLIITPLALLDFFDDRRQRNLESALPNFFRDLAGMNESGMTLPDAVALVARAEYGALTPHIRRLDQEMSWNVPFVPAMLRFGEKIQTPLATRSVDLIAKASRAGGDISNVLRAAAIDTYEFVTLKTDRLNNIFIYIVIIIISFFVYMFVIGILTSTFLGTMAEAGRAAEASGAGAGFMSSIDIDFYKRIFSHAVILQGFFSGLVAGQMGEGRVLAGLKYSAIMVFIGWMVFRLII